MDVVTISQKKNWIQLQNSVPEVSENSGENDQNQWGFWEDWKWGWARRAQISVSGAVPSKPSGFEVQNNQGTNQSVPGIIWWHKKCRNKYPQKWWCGSWFIIHIKQDALSSAGSTVTNTWCAEEMSVVLSGMEIKICLQNAAKEG